MIFDRVTALRFDPRTPLAIVPTAPRPRAGDPDQPRDDDGKWTDGGGGSGGGGKDEASPKGKRGPRTAKAERAVQRAAKTTAKREAKIGEAERKRDEALAAHDAARAKLSEAEAAAEEAEGALEDAEQEARALDSLEDEGEEPATDEQKAEAAAKVREAKLAAEKAEAARKDAEKAESRAGNRADRAGERIGEAEDDYAEALSDQSTAENDRDLAAIYDSTDDEDERSAKIEDRVTKASEELKAAQAREREAVTKFRTETDVDLTQEQREADRELRREQAETDRVFKAGEDGPDGEDWYTRSMRMAGEATAKHEAATRAIDRKRDKAERALKRVKNETWRAEASKEFWEDASDWHVQGGDHADDAEGTAEDRDGDGRTGKAEEDDDADE